MPNSMVLGGEAFGRCLGHEGTAFMNGINALIKETPESSLIPSTMSGYSKKSATWKRAFTRTQPGWIPSLQNCEK